MGRNKNKLPYLLIFSLLFVTLSSTQGVSNEKSAPKSFVIDGETGQFLRDGKPFRYVSGTMHYFRVPSIYWADRMQKMKAAGLNALDTYIEWCSHEPEPGVYNFEGNFDIESYFKLAQSFNLSIILRPGPYIDAERDMGGLPYWLLSTNPDMKLRTNDENYMSRVESWFSILLAKVKPYLYSSGGPIIMVQVENEYGSYSACDRDYTARLRDFIRSRLGKDILLFTTDGAGDGYLQCGRIPGCYATVDFGAGGNVLQAFKPQSHFEIAGPRVNSEFYPGWLDMWGEPHARVNGDTVARTLDEMLAINASVNIYVFHGGTSFGFTSGALPSNGYTPCITSYDYDAPLSEAGDPTEKYFLIRDVISKYVDTELSPVPAPAPKAAYGPVHLHRVADLWDLLNTGMCPLKRRSSYPLTFEALKQGHGYVLYCTSIQGRFADPATLELKQLADRAYIYIDQEFVGVLTRSGSQLKMPVQVRTNQTLCILVENQGRIAYGTGIKDLKGLTGNVTLSGRVLSDWLHYSLPFNDTVELGRLGKWPSDDEAGPRKGVLAIYSGSFAIQRNESQLADTFLHLPGWHKGIAFVNEHNLGRYWPVQGPQVTLYVPKSFLKPWPAKNRLVVVEQDRSPCAAGSLSCTVEFLSEPIINGPTPADSPSIKLFHKTM